jgi:RNA polymerase sigma-70 factor (ECF subfamily)
MLRLVRKIFHQDFGRLRAVEESDDVMNGALLRLLTALRSVRVATVAEFFRLATLQIRRELMTMAAKYPRPSTGGSPQHTTSSAADRVEDPADESLEPRSLAVWREFHEQVERLPDDERDVFDLLWYQELSRPEAAAVLGVSVPTLKRRWLRARIRLKEYLR